MLSDKELVEKHVIPCLNEMYLESETPFDFKTTFEMMGKYAPVVNGERKSISGCFYLSKEKYDKIMEKYTKDFQMMWHFPYSQEEYKKGEAFEELKRKHEENPDNEELKTEYEETMECMEHDRLWDEYKSKLEPIWEAYEKGKRSLKETRKMEAEIAKEYGCIQRSIDKDKVEFNVSGFAPNQDADYFKMVQNYYMAGASDSLVTAETPQLNREALKDAQLGKAFAENYKTNHTTL